MKLKSILSAGVFAVAAHLFTASSAIAVVLTDASVTDVGISVTEIFDSNSGQGSYTVSNNSAFGLTGFGVSNAGSTASVKFIGSASGCEDTYCYDAITLNSVNWLTEDAFSDGPTTFTFEDIFGDFINNIEAGETTINWYKPFDGDLQPGQTSQGFFLFSALTAKSIGIGIIGNGTGTTFFNNLAINNGVSVVPLPAALPLYGTGLALMGFIGWRRKQRKLVAA